jgi:acyl dehydratase
VEDLLITEELRDKIGVEWQPKVCEIERGAIRRFVQAIDDPNPLWQDEEYARQSKYGGIIAPPMFILTIGFEQIQQVLTPSASVTRLHGGTELECYQPVRLGDTITVITKIANIRERQGKMGKTVFMTFEITYKNQRRETVAKCRQIVISY